MSLSIKLLDDCYISFVNLDHRKDRLEKMVLTLTKAGLKAERTKGMLPHEYKGPEWKVKAMREGTPGAIGCHYSQVRIMEEALRQRKHAFVMEDDLVICSDFQKRMGLIEKFTNENPWDVIWLGGTFHVNPPYWHKRDLGRDAELTNDPRMIRTYGAFCTYAYVVNAISLVNILRLLDKNIETSIGIDFQFIRIQPQLKTFAFVPGCITQYDGNSDIALDRHGRPSDRIFSGFSKLNGTKENSAYWYQDKMEAFDPLKFNWHEAHSKKR